MSDPYSLMSEVHICKHCGGAVRIVDRILKEQYIYHVNSFMRRCFGNRDTYAEVESDA